jgi:hypothetical protein
MDKQDLNEFIGENLREVAWRKNYPIDEGIAGWIILNTLKGIGFTVAPEGDNYEIFRVFNYGKKNYSLSTSVSREELLVGWHQNPRASPKALYNSVYMVIDKFDKQVKDHFPKWKVPRALSNYLCEQRQTLGFKARDILDEALLEYFNEYQETVLAPLNGQGNDDLKPRILDELIASDLINLERINSAIANTRFEDRILSNLSETIDFLRNGVPIENEGFTAADSFWGYRGISENGVYDYVWGSFILKLAEVKGYSIRWSASYDKGSEDDLDLLETVCDSGWNALEGLIIR